MKYFIVTGASKGLGEATVQQLLKKGNHVICISRTENEKLEELANANGAELSFLQEDLTKHERITGIVQYLLSKIEEDNMLEEVYFINNAGMVDPIKPAGKADDKMITKAIHLNLLTPILITNEFIRLTESWNCKKVIINISSGAANRPIHGWNTYCSTKAGLDMFTKTVGLEQGQAASPTTILSFSPGIMDTEMQGVIRNSDKEDFDNIETFKTYYEEGQLRSPFFVAEKLLELILSTNVENGRVYDIKEFV
ncbi:(S)-benzoin forming benzil reductase [Sutcliffiella rhizosphaerae]|uniref:Benzil reductase ((S)-benzoin forming) n=1 Tax=Sutcliffiella rhizosphaerae TaxID=2880967 RepID=A0ABM8YLW5_9BACI|nr:(S)-benzoin forming benzil reductase [Sutcliffiella rhizosphaerae]CAG9620801.1 Benzil reductase ((S)-benzoin forming) [Sutcliffiella rhizosphaerae]